MARTTGVRHSNSSTLPGDNGGLASIPQFPFDQRHYAVEQVADMWNISRDTIRRLFAAEPGVLKIVRPGNRYKRTYSTLRIPESVLNRVYRRIAVRQ
jgi:hypothetical protein